MLNRGLIGKHFRKFHFVLFTPFFNKIMNVILHVLKFRFIKPYKLKGIIDKKKIFIMRLVRYVNMSKHNNLIFILHKNKKNLSITFFKKKENNLFKLTNLNLNKLIKEYETIVLKFYFVSIETKLFLVLLEWLKEGGF